MHRFPPRCHVAPALVLAVSAGLGGCAAAPGVVPFGIATGLDSAALGEHRELNVWLPPGYADADAQGARYPVLYVLDGGVDEDYPHLAGLVQFLTMYECMPKTIVVGIVNVDRYRDFTHASSLPADRETLPTGGGSARFLAFLERELLPWVDARFRTDGHRGIVGQSMGGLLAAEILLEHPALFDDYVLASPSLWWGGEALLARAGEALRAHAPAGKRVFVTLGTEDPKMQEVAERLVAALRRDAPQVQVGFEPMPDETHATILHRGVYRALEFFHGATHPGM